MPVTVVINRDYDGVTTCREVYAAGARYSIGNSNLQIFSAESRLLALYGSGNWLSVEIDGAPSGPGAAAAAAAAAAQQRLAPAPVEDLDLSPEFVVPDVAPSPPRTPVAARPRHVSAPVVPVHDDDDLPGARGAGRADQDPSDTSRDPDRGQSERMAVRSSSLRPVVFRPRTYRAARPGEAPAPTQRGPSSQLRPVVFRPKTYRAARDRTPADDPDIEPDANENTDENTED